VAGGEEGGGGGGGEDGGGGGILGPVGFCGKRGPFFLVKR